MSKLSQWMEKCDVVVDEQPIARLGKLEVELLSDGSIVLSKTSSKSTHYSGYLTLSMAESEMLLSWLADLHGEA
jgi:hypothetical protein